MTDSNSQYSYLLFEVSEYNTNTNEEPNANGTIVNLYCSTSKIVYDANKKHFSLYLAVSNLIQHLTSLL